MGIHLTKCTKTGKAMLSTVEICVKLQMTKTSEMCYNEEDTMWGLGVLPIGKTQQQCCF